MRCFFVFCGFFILRVSNTQSSDLFFDDELLASDFEPNMQDDLFASDSGPDIVDDPFISDPSSDVIEPSFPEQNPDDFHMTDSSLPADGVRDCSSSSRRFRPRSDICPKEMHFFDVRTDADVKKYWCSHINIEGFAGIPVCNLWLDGIESDPDTSGLQLHICRLSRFVFFLT